MDNNIYLITVFTKCESDTHGFVNLGSERTVGFEHTWEDAIDDVVNNKCDIWETCYDYAVIEEVKNGLYYCCFNRKFYKFNTEKEMYEEIEEPECMSSVVNIGIG